MKNLSIAVPDELFDKFLNIQEKHGFKNQSDTLIYIVNKVYELEKKEVEEE